MSSFLQTSAPTVDQQSLIDDQSLLDSMFDALFDELARFGGSSKPVSSITESAVDGLGRRIAVYRPDVIDSGRPLSFVGFFGDRRITTKPEIVEEIGRVDRRMLVELRSITGISAYCSFERADGNWANLVVINDDSAFEQLRKSPAHSYAAHRLSPVFYNSIRIHRGEWRTTSRVTSTKTYDFQSFSEKGGR